MGKTSLILAGIVILTLLFGGLSSANVIIFNSEKSYHVSVLVDNGSSIIPAVNIDGFTVFKLARNGTVEWADSGKDFTPLNASLSRGSFYSLSGFNSVASRARDGGVLLGFMTVNENGTFYPTLMKFRGNGSFEWAYIYKLGLNASSHVSFIYPTKEGILLSGYIENNTQSGIKFVPFLLFLRPNGTVVWARVYHPPLFGNSSET